MKKVSSNASGRKYLDCRSKPLTKLVYENIDEDYQVISTADKRVVEILIDFTRRTGHQHPHLMDAFDNYTGLLVEMGDSQDQARAKVIAMAPNLFGQ